MKNVIAICLLVLAGAAADAATEKATVTPAIKRTQAAVAGLSQKLDLSFRIPFPAELDIDPYLTRPIARMSTTQGELFCTEPVVNPFDGQGTIEWYLGPPDTKQFSREHVYCFFGLDDRGKVMHMGILSDGGWFRDGNEGTHQMIREADEGSDAFLSRAFQEYHRRAVASGDPQKAMLYLNGVERITLAVCELRRSQEVPAYPATARP